MNTDLQRRNRRMMIAILGVVAGMVGMAYASVPLYDLFCRVTGFGGTPGIAQAPSEVIADREITVRFDASVNDKLAWRFAPAFQGEFDEAFAFAARYAGYHASPEQSPGAWVAFREGNFLKGDYDFLARRLSPDGTRSISNAGPDGQRQGAWARVLPAGERLRIGLDEDFAGSLEGRPAEVRLTWLDEGKGGIEVSFGDRRTVNGRLRIWAPVPKR